MFIYLQLTCYLQLLTTFLVLDLLFLIYVCFSRLFTFETLSTFFANLASNFKSRGDFFFYFFAKK